MSRTQSEKVQIYINMLGLKPHIEGGYFGENYKNSQYKENRSLASTIYYLLKSGQVSRFHRLNCDEIWFFHDGSPILIHQINRDGNLETHKLGLALNRGELPQVLIPAHTVFGAEVEKERSFGLVSCMVSPGFEYQDFELFNTQTLLDRYPEHKQIIERLNGG